MAAVEHCWHSEWGGFCVVPLGVLCGVLLLSPSVRQQDGDDNGEEDGEEEPKVDDDQTDPSNGDDDEDADGWKAGGWDIARHGKGHLCGCSFGVSRGVLPFRLLADGAGQARARQQRHGRQARRPLQGWAGEKVAASMAGWRTMGGAVLCGGLARGVATCPTCCYFLG